MPTHAEIQNMQVGIWNCASGVNGLVNLKDISIAANNEPVRVQTITAIADNLPATITIDNRDPVVIPAGQAITLTPRGTIHNNVIEFIGTLGYVIEYTTNNFYGDTEGDI